MGISLMTIKTLSGRLFLNRDKSNLNSVSWSAKVTIVDYETKKKEKIHNEIFDANLTIRKGNSSIVLHTNNDGVDKNFESFLSKLRLISTHVRDFVEQCEIKRSKPTQVKTERYWLNDPEGIDKSFTGSLVKIYDTYSDTIEISSCERSARWYINSYLNRGKSEIGELIVLQRAIDRLIRDIGIVLKEVKNGA
ncbi:hypothetical protein KPN8_152 [Klebsiella phage KPN8]|nr:hypothetical protein KPN8_152 [Klebsiella phage KPN8]